MKLKIILLMLIFVIFLVSQGSSESFKTDKVIVLKLNYDNGNLNLNKINLQKGNLLPDKGDYKYKLYSKNKLIYSSNFNVPLTLYEDRLDKKTKEFIKSEKKLKKIDFQLAIPYYKDADKIKIYDKNNKLILSQKIEPKIEESTQSNCVALIENGDPSIKINVVFIPDGYTDLNQFRGDVLKHIDFNAKSEGILSREPYLENKNMFNFYYINEELYYGCEDISCNFGEIYDKASQCPYNQIIVLTNTNQYFGYAYSILALAPGYTGTLGTSSVTGPMITSHEFGHSFSELADEYFSLYPISSTYKANCDIANYNPSNPQSSVACPKWCSGPAKPPYTTECSNFNEADCKDLYNSRRYNCVWLDQPDPYFDTQCIRAFNTINIGTSCLEGTGCYHNCHGTNGYRPTPSDCIMFEFKLNNNIFDSVCQNHIKEVLSYYNAAPVIISKPVTIAVEDYQYSYQVNAIDRDNDTLTYSLINAPEEMVISQTGLISWVPSNQQIGYYSIKVEVKDNFRTTTQSFNLKVISKYCEDDTLIGNCSRSGSICFVDSGGCFAKYCDYGDLKYYCGKCGYECPEGLVCSNGDCVKPKTEEGIFPNMI